MEKRNHRKSDKKRKSAKNVDSFEKHFELKREKKHTNQKKCLEKNTLKMYQLVKKSQEAKKREEQKDKVNERKEVQVVAEAEEE